MENMVKVSAKKEMGKNSQAKSNGSQKLNLCNLGRDMEVLSDESDGETWTTTRKERCRKPKPYIIGGVIKKAIKTYSSRSRRAESMHSFVKEKVNNGEIQRPGSSAGQSFTSSSNSQENFLYTQNLDESFTVVPETFISQDGDNEVNLEEDHQREAIARLESVEEEEDNVDGIKTWIIFSIRNSSWDYVFRWDTRPLPFESTDFKKMIIEAVERSFGFPVEYKKHNIRLLRVEDIKKGTNTQNEAEAIEVSWYTFGGTAESRLNTCGNDKGMLKSSSPVIQKILFKLARANDFIVSFSSKVFSQLGEVNGCVFHLSAQDYGEELNDCIEYFDDVLDEVRIDVSNHENGDKCGSKYKIIKFTPYEDSLSVSDDVNVGDFAQDPVTPVAAEIECVQLSDSGSDCEMTMDNSEDELEPQPADGGRQVPCHSQVKRVQQFDLKTFIKNGEFIPGPMRPKLKKSTGGAAYNYRKLAELENLINVVSEDDHRRKKLPCPMVREYCHVYGVVDKVITDHRHPEAYFVRISDETKKSVLLRLHTNSKAVEKGPKIEIGDIIRVHRATVQDEWDSEVGDNVMVLSTSNHHNYVIFRIFDELGYKFHFDTCAKSVTIDDGIDRPRIAELVQFKLNQLLPHVIDLDAEEEEEGGERDILERTPLRPLSSRSALRYARSTRSSRLSLRKCAGSDGICDSDIASLQSSTLSEERIMDIEGIPSPNVSLLQINRNHSATNSDDSFVTALGDHDHHLERVDQVKLSTTEVNINSSEVFLSKTLEMDNLDTSIISKAPLISFRELKKTDSTIGLLCKVVAVSVNVNKGASSLLIKDFEGNYPPEEFRRRSFLTNQLNCGDDVLIIDVIKGAKFSKRPIVSDLQSSAGTDEIFLIQNVKVKEKGNNTPCTILEVDGEFCQIRRSNPKDMQFMFGMTCNSEQLSHSIQPSQPILSTSDCDEIYIPPTTGKHCNNDGSSPVVATYLTVPQFSDTPICEEDSYCSPKSSSTPKSSKERLRWTGKRRGRRKTRIHY